MPAPFLSASLGPLHILGQDMAYQYLVPALVFGRE
jgi:hypothetical protein